MLVPMPIACPRCGSTVASVVLDGCVGESASEVHDDQRHRWHRDSSAVASGGHNEALPSPEPVRVITNTAVPARFPWPDDCRIQGGSSGIVFSPKGDYRTAFVEAFPQHPGTFIRGEGDTVEEAEAACYKKYKIYKNCDHPAFEARHYRNGSGYCTACGTWFPPHVTGLPADPEPADGTPGLLERVLVDEDPAALTELGDRIRSIRPQHP